MLALFIAFVALAASLAALLSAMGANRRVEDLTERVAELECGLGVVPAQDPRE